MSYNLLRLDQGEVHTDRTTHTKEDLVPGAGTVQSSPVHVILCYVMLYYTVLCSVMLCSASI